MTPSEQNSELGKWFLLWWAQLRSYKQHFSSGTLGSRENAWKQIKTLKPDESLRNEMMNYSREKSIIWGRKKQAGERMRCWQDVERMVKNRFWEDELPASHEKNTKHHVDRNCPCGEPVHGPRFNLCTECLSRALESGA